MICVCMISPFPPLSIGSFKRSKLKSLQSLCSFVVYCNDFRKSVRLQAPTRSRAQAWSCRYVPWQRAVREGCRYDVQSALAVLQPCHFDSSHASCHLLSLGQVCNDWIHPSRILALPGIFVQVLGDSARSQPYFSCTDHTIHVDPRSWSWRT